MGASFVTCVCTRVSRGTLDTKPAGVQGSRGAGTGRWDAVECPVGDLTAQPDKPSQSQSISPLLVLRQLLKPTTCTCMAVHARYAMYDVTSAAAEYLPVPRPSEAPWSLQAHCRPHWDPQHAYATCLHSMPIQHALCFEPLSLVFSPLRLHASCGLLNVELRLVSSRS